MRSHSPSFQLPQPSFRQKPESMPCGNIHRHSGSPNRHSGESRNPGRVVTFTVIPAPQTVIPAQAGIYALRSRSPSFRLLQPSFRRKPESMRCGHTHRHSDSPNRHSGASRNPGRVVTFTVIPAQAGIQGVWSHSPSFRLPPTVIPACAGIYALRWTPVFAGMTGPYLNHLKRNTTAGRVAF